MTQNNNYGTKEINNENTVNPNIRTPITLHEVEDEMRRRVSFIDHEFTEGFNLIKHQPKSVTIFGSARIGPNNKNSDLYKQAEEIASKLAHMGYSIITGGGPGIMEGANKGAFEAKGRSIGLNIKLPKEQIKNPFTTHSMNFYYFFSRKVMLSFSAEAYVFFPGGYGTLDEFFEILTLVQTKKIENVPIILVGKKFWDELFIFVKNTLLDEYKTISPEDLNLVTITDDTNEVIDIVKRTAIRNGVRLHGAIRQ